MQPPTKPKLKTLGTRMRWVRLAMKASRTSDPKELAEIQAEMQSLNQVIAACSGPLPALGQVEFLASAFHLSEFEVNVLVLCAGWELDRSLLAEVLDPLEGPTFERALGLLPEPHWSMCTPESPLRYWQLIRLGDSPSFVTRSIRIDEAILHYLKGVSIVSEDLARLSRIVNSVALRSLAHSEIVENIADDGVSPGAIQLVGSVSDARGMATMLGEELNLPVREIQVADLPTQRAELIHLGRLLARDVILGALLPMVVFPSSPSQDSIRAVEFLLEEVPKIVLLVTERQILIKVRAMRTIRFSGPSPDERMESWLNALGPDADRLQNWIGRLLVQFQFSSNEIDQLVQDWRETPGIGSRTPQNLWKRCVDQVTPQVDGLAEQLQTRDGFDELILPLHQAELLRSILAQMNHRWQVNNEWGMSPSLTRGSGISVVFSGPSGTGKTLAAESLGYELDLPVYRVDLSRVVSKYIGETEKHLSRLFDAAERGGFILLFDEADSLFGKRSASASAHDRYANIEVSYLLQRIESYSGLAILTTNHREHLDAAFLRRMRFVVNFPMPGPSQRRKLWERAFPAEVPKDDLDYDQLAEAELSGGGIRNASLVAASLAASTTGRVSMEVLTEAMGLELSKHRKRLPSSGA